MSLVALLFACGLGLALPAIGARAQTIRVPRSCGEVACAQRYLDRAEPGTIVRFPRGRIRPGRGTFVLAVDSKSGVVLNGLRTDGVVLRITSSSGLSLVRADIRDAPAVGLRGRAPSLAEGGAIQVFDGQGIAIRDTTIAGSQSSAVLAGNLGGLTIDRSRFLLNAANGINAGPVIPLTVTRSLFRDNATGTDAPVLAKNPNPEVEVRGKDGRYYYAVASSLAGLAGAVKLTEFGFGEYDPRQGRTVDGTYIDTDRPDSRTFRLQASNASRDIFDGTAPNDLVFTGNTVIEDDTVPRRLRRRFGGPYTTGFSGFAAVPYDNRAPMVWTDIQTLDALIEGNRLIEPATRRDEGVDAALWFEISNRVVARGNTFATTTRRGRYPLVMVSDSRHVEVSGNRVLATSALTTLYDDPSRAEQSGDSHATDRLSGFRFAGNTIAGGGHRVALYDLADPDVDYPTDPGAPAAQAFLAARQSEYTR